MKHGVVLALALCTTLVRAQGVSPADAREQARFDLIVRGVVKAGFTSGVVVGHGQGPADDLFALTAVQGNRGALIAVVEPTAHGLVVPIELEHDQTPAQLGVRGVEFSAFLGARDLIDVNVSHRPLMLETSRSYDTHHILRRNGPELSVACVFEGGSSSSSSKGVGSITSARHVTVEKVGAGSLLRFDVKVVDEITDQRTNDRTSATTSRQEKRTRYELPASGTCREIAVQPVK